MTARTLLLLSALGLAAACGRSNGKGQPRSEGDRGRGGGGGSGGAGGTAGGGGAIAGNGGAMAGSGGAQPCDATRAACACDDVGSTCAAKAAAFCPFPTGSCPPTLEDALVASNWPTSGLLLSVNYTECEGGYRSFSERNFESGFGLIFGPDGALLYETLTDSCSRPVCGEAPALTSCRSCSVDTARPEGEGGQSGAPGENALAPCEIDGDGLLVMPAD